MRHQHHPPSAASMDSDMTSRQPSGQPRPHHANLKRKHGDDHERSRTQPRTQRVGSCCSKEPGSSEDAPQPDEPSQDASDDFSEPSSLSHWRAILSFHEMIEDPASAGRKYKALDAEQKLVVALGVRNLYLATSAPKSGTVRDRDRQILEHMQNAVGDVVDPAVVRDSGLRVSFYPGSTYTELRRFQDLDAKIGEHPHKGYFAQVAKTPRTFAAFVEARE